MHLLRVKKFGWKSCDRVHVYSIMELEARVIDLPHIFCVCDILLNTNFVRRSYSKFCISHILHTSNLLHSLIRDIIVHRSERANKILDRWKPLFQPLHCWFYTTDWFYNFSLQCAALPFLSKYISTVQSSDCISFIAVAYKYVLLKHLIECQIKLVDFIIASSDKIDGFYL